MAKRAMLKAKGLFRRSLEKVKRGWHRVSHHRLLTAVISGLVVAFFVAHGGPLFNSDPSTVPASISSASEASPLRVEFRPMASELFDVAFDHDIGVPKVSEQWAALHARGGVDVNSTDFELTLANRSQLPLTVTNIEAEVLGSRPSPIAWEGYVFTQGGEPIKKLTAILEDDSRGSTTPLRSSEGSNPSSNGPYFESHIISLQPGEIYQAAITIYVGENITRELQYRFDIAGNTASNGFSIHTPGSFRIAPRMTSYVRKYWSLSENNLEHCWVPVIPLKALPSCPPAVN
jgi:hypothetical protein